MSGNSGREMLPDKPGDGPNFVVSVRCVNHHGAERFSIASEQLTTVDESIEKLRRSRVRGRREKHHHLT